MKTLTICLYGAANEDIDPNYIKQTEVLGKELATHGHSMIYGGGGTGLMGAAARGVSSANGKIISVLPHFMKDYEGLYEDYTEIIRTETMAQRKEIMEDRADAFIVVPGGIGTMDEFFQAITLVSLDRKSAPIVLFNIDGYYDSIIAFIEDGIAKGFIHSGVRELCMVCNQAEDIIDAIESSLSA